MGDDKRSGRLRLRLGNFERTTSARAAGVARYVNIESCTPLECTWDRTNLPQPPDTITVRVRERSSEEASPPTSTPACVGCFPPRSRGATAGGETCFKPAACAMAARQCGTD